tara:strand:+ start:1692 stop:2567 length:876 start_codon:yes stop_codon:yes gene_type:complete
MSEPNPDHPAPEFVPDPEDENFSKEPYVEESYEPLRPVGAPLSSDPSQPPGADPSASSKDTPGVLQRPGPALGIGCGGCAGYFLLGQIVPGILFGIYLAASGRMNDVQAATMESLPFLTGAAVIVAIAFVVVSRRLGWLDEGPLGPDAIWKRFAWPIAIAAACPFGAELISLFQIHVLNLPFQEQEILVSAAKAGGIGFWLAIVVGAPLGEELFFRRWFYGITRKPLGLWLAFLASGLAFAIIHFNPTGFVAYLWIAACCTFAYERSGSVWGAVFVHFVNNSIAAAMLSQA